MRVVAVDDEPIALAKILDQLSEISFVSETHGFADPFKAFEFLEKNGADAALLDIHMYGMNGLELARRAKKACPRAAIIFLTGYSEYALDAFKVRASGYLLKPASVEEIESELRAVSETAGQVSGVGLYVQTFGLFEVFMDGAPVRFTRVKSKEIFAYLVDRRGAAVNTHELAAALWEEQDESPSLLSLIRNCVADLRQSLEAVGAQDVLDKAYGSLAVRPDKIKCDYYDFLKEDIRAINAYMGEYMTGYPWAEFTTAALSQKTGIM